MVDTNIIESVITEWSVRSPNGLYADIWEEENLDSLYESCIFNGISDEDTLFIINESIVLVEKGKHPERQAYNKNGILVTFPTPEYKARAISKGTHFEKNPKSSQSNLFGGGSKAPAQAAPGATNTPPSGNNMDSQQTELPSSDSENPQTPPAKKEVPEPGEPGTPASTPPIQPTPAGGSSLAGSTSSPAQGNLAVEPTAGQTPQNVAQPQPVQPEKQKTPEELAAEKEVIKRILNTNDTTPTVPNLGGNGLTEQLQKLTKIALEMNLNEAVKFLSNHL
jgi:hypothetical protein